MSENRGAASNTRLTLMVTAASRLTQSSAPRTRFDEVPGLGRSAGVVIVGWPGTKVSLTQHKTGCARSPHDFDRAPPHVRRENGQWVLEAD